MRIDLSCPVENQGTIIKTNTETNEPYLLLKLFNLSEKTISSMEFRVLAYSANGDELDQMEVSLQGLSAQPKTYFAENKAVSLVGMEHAKHFFVAVDKVTFLDDSVYEPNEENIIETDDAIASIDDAILLRHFVPQAVCFASEHEDHWTCVCGRPNFVDAPQCVRCFSEKEDVLRRFSSRETVNCALEQEHEEEEKRMQEEEARLKLEKEHKKQKTKKAITISVISVIVLAILFVAGLFTYRTVLNVIADKAVENGNYLKAYELFAKTGSSKIGEVTKYVQGNTPENLMFQSGLVAEDEENLYYLTLDNTTYSFHLIKENKETKETATLTDAAGGSLNVTSDWIYFIDVENGYVKRISKDGQNIESVIDHGVSHLSVIGNAIYYTKTDYDNPGNLSEEQCAILAAQGQIATYSHLYKMDAETKKSELVSDVNLNTLAIYGNRIYYLTQTEDKWTGYNLHSMDLNGKDIKVEVDVPVATFLIHEDDLYFAKMYNDDKKDQEISGAPDLDYSIVKKNLTTGETVTINDSYMTTYMNANENALFFMALDRNEYLASLSGESDTDATQSLYKLDFETGKIERLVAGELQIFNVAGDEVIMYLGAQGMCRVKADGTGFEQILTESQIASQLLELEDAVDSEEIIIE